MRNESSKGSCICIKWSGRWPEAKEALQRGPGLGVIEQTNRKQESHGQTWASKTVILGWRNCRWWQCLTQGYDWGMKVGWREGLEERKEPRGFSNGSWTCGNWSNSRWRQGLGWREGWWAKCQFSSLAEKLEEEWPSWMARASNRRWRPIWEQQWKEVTPGAQVPWSVRKSTTPCFFVPQVSELGQGQENREHLGNDYREEDWWSSVYN